MRALTLFALAATTFAANCSLFPSTGKVPRPDKP